MQILDYQQHRLHLALPQQQPLQRLQGLPPTLRGIEPRPLRVLDRYVEKREEYGQRGLQRAVQRQELAGHLLAHLAAVVTGLDGEVAAQELDDGKVRRGLPVRHRGGLEHQPPLTPMRVGELPHQPRLADSWLAYDRDELAVALARSPQRLPQQLDLRVAAHKAREPPRGSGV